jgi:hypothetical protein
VLATATAQPKRTGCDDRDHCGGNLRDYVIYYGAVHDINDNQ